jgi:hypothetical protein
VPRPTPALITEPVEGWRASRLAPDRRRVSLVPIGRGRPWPRLEVAPAPVSAPVIVSMSSPHYSTAMPSRGSLFDRERSHWKSQKRNPL